MASSPHLQIWQPWPSRRKYWGEMTPLSKILIIWPLRPLLSQQSEGWNYLIPLELCALLQKLPANRIFQLEAFSQTLTEDTTELMLNIKYGFDGSGGHAIFNQLGNCATNNMVMAMFCPLSITSRDGSTIFWSQKAATLQQLSWIEKHQISTLALMVHTATCALTQNHSAAMNILLLKVSKLTGKFPWFSLIWSS